MRHLTMINKIESLYFSALERTFLKGNKMLTYMGMQDKERIARIGSYDPESHLGIPYSHVPAIKFKTIYCRIENTHSLTLEQIRICSVLKSFFFLPEIQIRLK